MPENDPLDVINRAIETYHKENAPRPIPPEVAGLLYALGYAAGHLHRGGRSPRGPADRGAGGGPDDDDEDPHLPGRVLDVLRTYPEGLTAFQVNRREFGGHRRTGEIREALHRLRERGDVTSRYEKTPGRPTVVWALAKG